MRYDQLAADAFGLPVNSIAYFLSRRLAEHYPGKAILEGDDYSFRPEEHWRDGQSAMSEALGMHNQFEVGHVGVDEDLSYTIANALYEVEWSGLQLLVLLLTWSDDGCSSRHYWIVADSAPVAEAYFKSVCDWCSEVRGEVLVFDGGQWYKSEALFNAIKSATFENLILPGRQKEEIQQDFARFFASRDAYERHGIPWKRGVLLIGPPGNGKTHTVKALANWLEKPCLYVKSFTHRHMTEQDCMREVFHRARKTQPCVLVMEDLDSLLTPTNRSFFLNELDGFASNTGVVVLATTNYPERLDPAILERPSRFDRKYYFELPALSEREAYIRQWNQEWHSELRLSDSGIIAVATTTDGFSFAYLKELFLSAMMRWMDEAAPRDMGDLVCEQVATLRAQMVSAAIREASQSICEPDDIEYEGD